MKNNLLESLKGKKTFMKLSVAALVGGVLLYSGVSRHSVSAMIRSVTSDQLAQVPKEKDGTESVESLDHKKNGSDQMAEKKDAVKQKSQPSERDAAELSTAHEKSDQDVILPIKVDTVKPAEKEECTFKDAKNFDYENFKRKLDDVTKDLKAKNSSRIGMALDLRGDVAVVGDIHGDYKSLQSVIIQTQKWLNEDPNKEDVNKSRKVLFLGDIVDRGNTTLTLDYLFDFYLKNKGKVFILRGNHETDSCFPHDLVKEGFLISLVESEIKNYFNELPYAAVINNDTFASHAGFPSLSTDETALKNACEQFFTGQFVAKDEFHKDMLWPDLDEKLAGIEVQDDSETGRKKYSKDFVRKFFDIANSIDLGNERHLNLQHMIVGHKHAMGSWRQVNLSDSQTFNWVISTNELLKFIFKDEKKKGEILLASKGKAPIHAFDVEDLSGTEVVTESDFTQLLTEAILNAKYNPLVHIDQDIIFVPKIPSENAKKTTLEDLKKVIEEVEQQLQQDPNKRVVFLGNLIYHAFEQRKDYIRYFLEFYNKYNKESQKVFLVKGIYESLNVIKAYEGYEICPYKFDEFEKDEKDLLQKWFWTLPIAVAKCDSIFITGFGSGMKTLTVLAPGDRMPKLQQCSGEVSLNLNAHDTLDNITVWFWGNSSYNMRLERDTLLGMINDTAEKFLMAVNDFDQTYKGVSKIICCKIHGQPVDFHTDRVWPISSDKFENKADLWLVTERDSKCEFTPIPGISPEAKDSTTDDIAAKKEDKTVTSVSKM